MLKLLAQHSKSRVAVTVAIEKHGNLVTSEGVTFKPDFFNVCRTVQNAYTGKRKCACTKTNSMTISYVDVSVSRLTDIFKQQGGCVLKPRKVLNVDVLLTVHLSIILVTDQLNAQILVL